MTNTHSDTIKNDTSKPSESTSVEVVEDTSKKSSAQTPSEEESSQVENLINWEEEAASYKDKWLRTVAEMENLRKRSHREREDALKYGVTKLAGDVVSVADNLSRALSNCPSEPLPEMEGLLAGLKLIEGELKQLFSRHGIQEINPLGEPFDPHFHQAMFEVPCAEDQTTGTVAEVLQVGYILHGRLLRPALVGVFKKAS